jgi:hypothetical protein
MNRRQRGALIALAVLENYRAAAAALDMTKGSLRPLISRVRQMFLDLRHDGESPSQQ